jgi:hypothetical protein
MIGGLRRARRRKVRHGKPGSAGKTSAPVATDIPRPPMVDSSSSGGAGSSPPPVAVGGPTTASWREHVLARVGEYRFLIVWLDSLTEPPDEEALSAVRVHLDAAKETVAAGSQRFLRKLWSGLTGASVERARSHLDAAEVELLHLVPDSYFLGQLPNLVAHVRAHLPGDDPRRVRVEEIYQRTSAYQASDASLRARQEVREQNPDMLGVERDAALTTGREERDAVVAAVREASSQERRAVMRVRSFRNLLYVSALVLSLGAIGLAIIGVTSPQAVPVCFNPTGLAVCPTEDRDVPGQVGAEGQPPEQQDPAQQEKVDDVVRRTANRWDIALVELVGLIAAAVAAAQTLRRERGTSTEFSLPVAAAVLKLPTGALTALLGLLLMRGGFVPGLSALDSPPQIIAWAVIFGSTQQLLTRLIDQRAQGVLDDVSRPPERPGTQAEQPAPIAS